MNIDPLATALKEINETKDLVQSLIVSSESFDYLKAKAALRELSRKVRELDRLRARFETLQRGSPANIRVLEFRPAVSGPTEAPL